MPMGSEMLYIIPCVCIGMCVYYYIWYNANRQSVVVVDCSPGPAYEQQEVISPTRVDAIFATSPPTSPPPLRPPEATPVENEKKKMIVVFARPADELMYQELV